MQFFAIELPTGRPATATLGQLLKGGCVALGIALAGQKLKIFPHKLIDAFSGGFGALAGALKNLLVDGKRQVHTHIIRAHGTRVKPI